jgi:urease accessory protein
VVDAHRWAVVEPADLPALGGALTDILGEDHGAWRARLFVG